MANVLERKRRNHEFYKTGQTPPTTYKVIVVDIHGKNKYRLQAPTPPSTPFPLYRTYHQKVFMSKFLNRPEPPHCSKRKEFLPK